MYSKHSVTKPINKTSRFEKGYIVWSSHHELPQKRVLFITKDEQRKTTTLKIFSIYNFEKCIKEKIIEKNCELLGILPDGSILLNQGRNSDERQLLKLDSDDLNVISSQYWEGGYSVGVVDNDHFFVIKPADDIPTTLEYVLSTYQWKEGQYVKVNKEKFLNQPLTGVMEKVQSLGEKRFCCQMRGYNSNEFRVLIFEIEANNKVKELGVITPKGQHRDIHTSASGEIVALPNGKLLTYHPDNDNVQIWDTKSLSCVYEWDWADIQTPEAFSVSCLTIIPFPDSVNFLVCREANFYLFNSDTRAMKHIDLASKVHPYYSAGPHCLPYGKVISFVKHDRKDLKDHVKVDIFDLPEIVHTRKILTQSQLLARLALHRGGLPFEISDKILSYTVTPDAKEMLSKNTDESAPIIDTDNVSMGSICSLF